MFRGLFIVFVLSGLTFLKSNSVLAQVPTTECVQKADLEEISAVFPQFAAFLNDKTEFCEIDFGAQWFKVINALMTLKQLELKEPATDVSDALTYKAIAEPNWWAYFIKRAKVIQINPTCQAGVGAFVFPMLNDGTIYLCPPFFEGSKYSQASIMMHEVRHFDGHKHVTCERGIDNGSSGSCDKDILNKGSYAITVQTLVGLSKSNVIDPGTKNMLEAEAIFTAFNRFNVLPKVKINESIVLSNTSGEVYRWNINKDYSLVGQLNAPARVYNSYNNLTIFPLDGEFDAYRMDQDLMTTIDNPGLFAVYYNKETPEERTRYKNMTYLSSGGLLKDNTLITYCADNNPIVKNLDENGTFNRILALSKDEVDSEALSLLVSTNGDLLEFKCGKNSTSVVDLIPTDLKLASDLVGIKESFGLGGITYAILKNGQLAILQVDNSVLTVDNTAVFPFNNSNWVSATPFSNPELFN